MERPDERGLSQVPTVNVRVISPDDRLCPSCNVMKVPLYPEPRVNHQKNIRQILVESCSTRYL